MAFKESLPSEPFAAWLNERVAYWERRLGFDDGKHTRNDEVTPLARVCQEVGWPESDSGYRRLYRMRHRLAESAIGKKNGKRIPGMRTVAETESFSRWTVQDALHHAGVQLGELYPYEALVDEFATEYLVPRDLAGRLADAWIETTWQTVWRRVGLFVSEEARPQCYCRACKRTTRLFMGSCDACGAEHTASMVAAVMASVVRRDPGLVTPEILAQARWLREQYQLPYQSIAAVMAVYHGVTRDEETWRKRLRRIGVEAAPHGVPFGAMA